MSIQEGKNFECFIHGYKTMNLNDWNEHCIKTKHTISGTAPCVDCNKPVQFTDIPFVRIGQIPPLTIQVKCEDCA